MISTAPLAPAVILIIMHVRGDRAAQWRPLHLTLLQNLPKGLLNHHRVLVPPPEFLTRRLGKDRPRICIFNKFLVILTEKAMASHSSTFAQKIPWMEEPGRLQSMGSLESDITERLHFQFSLSCTGEGNGNPLQCSCLENPRDGGAWWAAVYGVAQSRTRLK